MQNRLSVTYLSDDSLSRQALSYSLLWSDVASLSLTLTFTAALLYLPLINNDSCN